MSNAAKTVVRALTCAQRRDPAPLDGYGTRSSAGRGAASLDPFAKAVARKLESRGVARVPGVEDHAPEPEWFDLAIEHRRRQETAQAESEARRQAEEEARLPTPAKLARALSVRRGDAIPLNGAEILRAALTG